MGTGWDRLLRAAEADAGHKDLLAADKR